MGEVVRPVRMNRRNGLVLLSLAVENMCRGNNYVQNFPRQNMSELPTPEQQLAANQQLLKILPFVLGFGWVVMIPISYLFIAPVVSNDIGIQIGVTIGIVIATGIADAVFLKIMTKNVETMMRQLEGVEVSLVSQPASETGEDWYVTHEWENEGAPEVVGIYEENYGVNIGDGAIPIEFYIGKWGTPDGYGATDYEKQFKQSSTESETDGAYSPGNSILD